MNNQKDKIQTMNTEYKRYMFCLRKYAGIFIILIMMVSCITSKKVTETKASQNIDSIAVQSNQASLEDAESNQQVSFQYSSETIEPSRIVSKTIEFANGNTLDVFQGERYAESPGGQRHAVLKFADLGDSLTDLSIYDNNGNKILELKVAPMDKMAIADDGRFATYGFEPTRGIAFKSNLICYDKNYKKVYERKNDFGVNHKAVFAFDSDIFVFWASSNNRTEQKEETILIFDGNYNLLGENTLRDIPKFSLLKEIEINSRDKQIILHRINSENNSMKEEKIILNLQGEKIK